MQNRLMFKKKTFCIKGPENEDFINESVTARISNEIPEEYHLKQVVSCDINYAVCSNEWMVQVVLILEKV